MNMTVLNVSSLDELIMEIGRAHAIAGLTAGRSPAPQVEADAKFEEVSSRLEHLVTMFVDHPQTIKIRDATLNSNDDISNFGSMSMSLFLAGDTEGAVLVIQAMFAFAYMMGLEGRTEAYPPASAAE